MHPGWLGRLFAGVLAIIVMLPLVGSLYQAIATVADIRADPPSGELIDVGGYRLYFHCVGTNRGGRATVVLETGLGGGATSADWAWVQPEVAKITKVCAYDRAGLGWSDRGSQPRDAQHIAAELHAGLENSHTPGPYVLAGWSYGGLYARRFAGQYPDEVAGVVLIDSSSPEQCNGNPIWQAQCASTAQTFSTGPILAWLGVIRGYGLFQPASGLPGKAAEKRIAALSATRDWDALQAEYSAAPATSRQVLSSGSLGNIPLFVVTATDHGAPADVEQLWQTWQSGYTALSTNSVQRVVQGATHNSLVLSSSGSKMTVDAILQVLEAARTGGRLQP